MLNMILSNGGWTTLLMFLLVIPYLSINLMMEGNKRTEFPILSIISKLCGVGIFILFLIAVIVYDMWC